MQSARTADSRSVVPPRGTGDTVITNFGLRVERRLMVSIMARRLAAFSATSVVRIRWSAKRWARAVGVLEMMKAKPPSELRKKQAATPRVITKTSLSAIRRRIRSRIIGP